MKVSYQSISLMIRTQYALTIIITIIFLSLLYLLHFLMLLKNLYFLHIKYLPNKNTSVSLPTIHVSLKRCAFRKKWREGGKKRRKMLSHYFPLHLRQTIC